MTVMSNPMNWKPGPARCRSKEFEAEILAVDMGGTFPFLGRIRKRGDSIWEPISWRNDGGQFPSGESSFDLLPPKLSRDEVAAQCAAAYMASHRSIAEDIRAALDHYDQLRREGLCDE